MLWMLSVALDSVVDPGIVLDAVEIWHHCRCCEHLAFRPQCAAAAKYKRNISGRNRGISFKNGEECSKLFAKKCVELAARPSRRLVQLFSLCSRLICTVDKHTHPRSGLGTFYLLGRNSWHSFPYPLASPPTAWRSRRCAAHRKTRRPVASSSTIPTFKNPGVARPGIEPCSPWREASRLTTQAPGSHKWKREQRPEARSLPLISASGVRVSDL
ncbi:hypothetical protein PR048_000539 [Dryococelus australis]|uniref:Secreted protein n=1 Tax=Dryococelus australis TaxID=614101 RepID=A0ABQ9IEX6_9NEOP|nr:hypothetical protein PR048_000539 [Dryococelus australis]